MNDKTNNGMYLEYFLELLVHILPDLRQRFSSRVGEVDLLHGLNICCKL
jgi:hypothetical protein